MVWINALVALRRRPDRHRRRGRQGRRGRASASRAGDKAAEIIGNLARSSAAAPRPDGRAGGAGPGHVPRRRRHVHAELALRPRRRAFGRRGGHARPVRGRRHRLGALPAGLRGQAQRAAARRHPTSPSAPIRSTRSRPRRWSSARRRWRRCTQYMLDEGEPSSFAAAYDDPRCEAYPERRPRSATPSTRAVHVRSPRSTSTSPASVINTWHPPESVNRDTPKETDAFMTEVLSGKRLL